MAREASREACIVRTLLRSGIELPHNPRGSVTHCLRMGRGAVTSCVRTGVLFVGGHVMGRNGCAWFDRRWGWSGGTTWRSSFIASRAWRYLHLPLSLHVLLYYCGCAPRGVPLLSSTAAFDCASPAKLPSRPEREREMHREGGLWDHSFPGVCDEEKEKGTTMARAQVTVAGTCACHSAVTCAPWPVRDRICHVLFPVHPSA